MNFEPINPARKTADDFQTMVEIPAHSAAVKYEIDPSNGLLTVDRFVATAMHYPCDYGFVPDTLSSDGDPLDVLIITPLPVQPGCIMRTRAIGMLRMSDEKGEDNKILALPIQKICAQYAHQESIKDISPVLLESIWHFFEHYKDLEPGKWVKVEDWASKEEAARELAASLLRFEQSSSQSS